MKKLRHIALVSVLVVAITVFAQAAGESFLIRNGFQALVSHALQIQRWLPSVDPIGMAVQEFQKAAQVETSSDEAVLMLGLVHQSAGDFDTALRYFTIFAEQNPEEDWVYAIIGDTYMELGESEQAWDAYHKAGATDSYSRAYFGIGNLALKNGEYVEARSAFETALEDAPEFIEARLGLAKAQYFLSEFEEAVEVLELAQLQNPRSPEIQHYLALTYEALGKNEQAEHARQRVLELTAPSK